MAVFIEVIMKVILSCRDIFGWVGKYYIPWNCFCGPLLILLANESEVVGWKTNNEVDDAKKEL